MLQYGTRLIVVVNELVSKIFTVEVANIENIDT